MVKCSISFSGFPKTLECKKTMSTVKLEHIKKTKSTMSKDNDSEMKQNPAKRIKTFVWLLEHTRFLRGSEIARLFCLCKIVNSIDNEVFWKVQAKRTFPLNNVMEAIKGKESWKHYYKRCFVLFGQDGELNFMPIVEIAKDIRAWVTNNAPSISKSLNIGTDVTELSMLLKERGCKNRGHLAFWTEIDGQDMVGRRHFEHGFFGGFQFSNHKGYMQLLSAKRIIDSIRIMRPLRISEEMSHCFGHGCKLNWHTLELVGVLMKDGSVCKITSGSTLMRYPQGGGDFMGLMKWYRDALYKSEFRIERSGAINRVPRNYRYGSETIKSGLRIRVRTLYVPEKDTGPYVTIMYEFELDCALGQSPSEGILRSWHFDIGEDSDVELESTEGIMGFYPTIGPGMDTVRYTSQKKFLRNRLDCWMQGSFLFHLNTGRDFRVDIEKFDFNWRESPIV